MTASFLKSGITDADNDEDDSAAHGMDAVAARVLTVGLGALAENGRQLAYATPDPSDRYGDASHRPPSRRPARPTA
jgi:hypothetical protein